MPINKAFCRGGNPAKHKLTASALVATLGSLATFVRTMGTTTIAF
jgi:hypothetical protein